MISRYLLITLLIAGVSTAAVSFVFPLKSGGSMGAPVFLAAYYGVNADAGWWVTLAILETLFSIATPPVPAGNISGLSVIMAQLLIPSEGLVIGAALVMIMDFMCTGGRVFLLHLEMLLQADSLDLIDREVLEKETAGTGIG